MGGDSQAMLVFIRGRQCSPPGSRGWQRVGGLEGGTYHTLATGTDAVGVPVAASCPIVYHLVHEDHIPCTLRLANQLTLLGVCRERHHMSPQLG